MEACVGATEENPGGGGPGGGGAGAPDAVTYAEVIGRTADGVAVTVLAADPVALVL